jgi:hypothetical protein
VAALGVTDPAAMAATVDTLMPFIESLVEIPTRPVGDGLHALTNPEGADLAVVGVVNDYLVVASHQNEVGALFESGPKLSGTDLYRRATGALPSGGITVLYVDVQGLLGVTGATAEELAAIAPLQAVAVSVSGDAAMSKATAVVLIDY